MTIITFWRSASISTSAHIVVFVTPVQQFRKSNMCIPISIASWVTHWERLNSENGVWANSANRSIDPTDGLLAVAMWKNHLEKKHPSWAIAPSHFQNESTQHKQCNGAIWSVSQRMNSLPNYDVKREEWSSNEWLQHPQIDATFAYQKTKI